MLLYHHCRSLESVVFGEVRANPKYSDLYLKHAYLWLKGEVGFYPLFLAVGATKEDIFMTGYPNQWKRVISTKIVGRRKDGVYIQKNVLIKRGEFPNDVLFSFEEVDGIFTDYEYWHFAFNASTRNKMSDYDKRLIFKPSWNKSKWLRKVRSDGGSVQMVTPKLYLPSAKRILVRNNKTKRILEEMGFKNVTKRAYRNL